MSALAPALEAIRARLGQRGLSVRIGAPTADVDLSIWPWQLVLVPGPRATPIGGGTRAAFDPDRLALELRFLLVCKDADDAVAKLTLAHAVIVQAPVVQVDGVNVQVVSETLAPADLSALFAAAGIKLSLSSAYVLRSTV